MLAKGKQRWCEGIPLLAPFPLQNVPPPTLGIPPRVGGWAPVKHAHERQQLRRDIPELGQKCCPGHRVVRAATIQRHQHRIAACRQGDTHVGCQRVGAGSGLQGELVWARGEVKRGGPLSGERFGHKAAEHVACCYAPHAAVWLAQCREACHCERRGDVCGDTCLCQLRGGFEKQETRDS